MCCAEKHYREYFQSSNCRLARKGFRSQCQPMPGKSFPIEALLSHISIAYGARLTLAGHVALTLCKSRKQPVQQHHVRLSFRHCCVDVLTVAGPRHTACDGAG